MPTTPVFPLRPCPRSAQWSVLVVLAKLLISLILFPLLISALGRENYQAELFPDNYDLLATNLLAGRGYRMYEDTSLTMLRTPGFVWILAVVFWAFGKSLLAVQAVQIAMAVITAWLTFEIALRVVDSRGTAVVGALIVLFHPGVLIAETRGGIEITTMFTLAACVWFLLRALESARALNYAVFGLMFGATMLVRSSVALLAPVVVLIALWRRPAERPLGRTVLNLLIAGACASAVLAPWVARNYIVSGQFVPTMTVGGLAMFQGVHVVKNLDSGRQHHEVLDEAAAEQLRVAHEMNLRVRPEFFPQFYSPSDEIAYYNELARRAWRELSASLPLLARTIGHNAWAFWFQGRTERATTLNVLLTAPLVLLMLLGAWLSRSARAAYAVVLGSIVAFILPHLLIMGLARYHVPLIPLVAVFAAVPLMALLGRVQRLRPLAGEEGKVT